MSVPGVCAGVSSLHAVGGWSNVSGKFGEFKDVLAVCVFVTGAEVIEEFGNGCWLC